MKSPASDDLKYENPRAEKAYTHKLCDSKGLQVRRPVIFNEVATLKIC